MTDQWRLDAARDIVTDYLRGDIDPDRNPDMFDDDIVYFAIARLDRHDTNWLLAQVANPQWPHKIRADIAGMMPGHYAEGQAALGADDH
ncbi:hypothetical protein ACQP2U_30325 [Nocardia sp. CA-084685]|jgi:hypothetical protein|uniref:hypothetical protein n=1 Tax=Nocardia sp. CA-084685 TaxID=3239970 RepID=UPI003D97EFB3